MAKFLIIDGNAILHRAYHAIPDLTNSKGEHTNALYGFISILLNLTTTFNPTHLVVCFDEKEKTFRKKDFEAYQAKRPKMDEWLSSQIVLVKDCLIASKICNFSKGGYEADDLIGTIVKKVDNGENDVVIATGDRDIFQLITKRVKVFVPVKGIKEGKLYGISEVREEFEFDPIQIIDYKALVGDSSDNYPGVVGIGPKTARELIVKYKTIENIYKNIKDIPERVRSKLETGKKDAYFFHKLATIFCEIPLKLSLSECNKWDLGSSEAIIFMQNMGFKSLLARIEKRQLNLI